MKINNLLNFFAPKDQKFIPLLKETADTMKRSADLLQELFTISDMEQRNECCRLIKAEEIKGDKATGRILKALNETFITPFDREDIDTLADEMDDVIDAINRTAQKVMWYEPQSFPECTAHLTRVIKEGTIEVQGAINELAHFKRNDQELRKHYKQIKKLEEEADALYEKGIMALFHDEKNALELIKSKEIIQELEKTANKINNTGKVLKTIFVKYA